MSRKIRIQRKRKPALYHSTRRLFAFGRLCTGILNVVATYGGAKEKDAYLRVQIENRAADTRLKSERECKLVAENQRIELLNIEKRLQLEETYGPKRVAELLGEPVPDGSGEFDEIPHTV